MSFRLAGPLAALCVLALSAGSAVAGSAVISADMTLRKGPGDQFPPLVTLVAGSLVDLHECNVELWCRVEHADIEGWVHVQRVDKPTHASGGSAQADDDTASSESGGDSGGGKSGGGSRSRPTSDGGSSGLSKRQNYTGGGSDGSDSPPATVSTEVAPAPACLRC